tara:strand:+ start:117 stop:695 length:579 start_codon:yes stop_codon:yes gene_type:complete
LIKNKFFFLNIFIIYILSTSIAWSNLQENIIKKLLPINTLSFEFNQKISNEEEIGECFIKYPLLMKCNYQNSKQKIIISNGRTVAIIKKKYKKIYYYPIKTTPLFFILKKEKIINLLKTTKPTNIDSNLVAFTFFDKNNNKVKILFDKNSLKFKGWITTDAYSNKVSFRINNLKINNKFPDNLFKIPKEEDL